MGQPCTMVRWRGGGALPGLVAACAQLVLPPLCVQVQRWLRVSIDLCPESNTDLTRTQACMHLERAGSVWLKLQGAKLELVEACNSLGRSWSPEAGRRLLPTAGCQTPMQLSGCQDDSREQLGWVPS